MKAIEEHVLVVDDAADIRELVAYHLQQAGMEVTGVGSGKQALDLLEERSYSLVILDIMMDDLDGMAVLQHLRAERLTLPVILLSARQEVEDKVMGLGLGADDYVSKPFSPSELVARVQAQIRRAHGMQSWVTSHVLEHGSLRLDPQSQTVYKRGRPILLSNTECLLLQAFLECPDEAQTKSQLFQEVWGHEMYNENVLSVYIRRLRQKIEDDASNPSYIQTIWGLGYRITTDTAMNTVNTHETPN